MSDFGPTLLMGAALILGLQHGIDWDHIAAIADVTGTTGEPRQGFLLGTLYALGHAAVVTSIGLLAIIVGLELPRWLDSLMEPFVGVTLIFLGLWILYSLAHDGKQFQLRSRWMLLFDGLRMLWDWMVGRLSGVPRPERTVRASTYGYRTAIGIGMIHGIGAETPSQVLLFIAATGAGGQVFGSVILLTFVVGLVISNSALTVLSIFGYTRARRHTRLFLGVGALAAFFSLAIGAIFLTGQAGLLPPLLASGFST